VLPLCDVWGLGGNMCETNYNPSLLALSVCMRGRECVCGWVWVCRSVRVWAAHINRRSTYQQVVSKQCDSDVLAD